MKLPTFDYRCPTSIEEAIQILSANEGSAKIVSGGQSLMPILAFRLAAPALLVDLNRISGLDEILIGDDGVQLGALVRWRDIERNERLKFAHPLLGEAIRHVAHYQIRNRGTVGGSLAHADPAAELPALAVTCDASITVQGPRGRRSIAATDFFVGPLTTSLDPNEIVLSLHLPPWPAERLFAFEEFSRRQGDFAVAGVALFYDLAGGRICNAHFGAFGVGDVPLRLPAAEEMLNGRPAQAEIDDDAMAEVIEQIDARDDVHADGEYRRALLGTLLLRALRRAAR